MSEILETLFGSKAKTRILRFFLLNPDNDHSIADITQKNMLSVSQVRKELNALKKIKFVTEKAKKREKYFVLNKSFHFYPELRGLIAKSNIYPQCKSLGRIKGIGDAKLVLISGIFLNHSKSKVDMILVVNNVNRSKLRSVMNNLEAEIGKEISFVLMNSEEFKYRLDMLDRFLIDFLDGPYNEIVNKIPGLKRFVAGLKKY
ncbi:MAG: hypothetical protein ACD_11C00103G0054 [uncultured bacterium]|nr:MAG: hypothetical protein ACD_11C00103G0054 [uncultured bacterium]HBR71208.1 hypothetical protein [Candidatus Moranbacteria bacterium]